MKGFRILLGIALVGVLLSYSGCGSNSGPGESVEDAQVRKLSKTWKCTAATLNGQPATVASQPSYNYVGTFNLEITGTAGSKSLPYKTSGRPTGTKVTPWPASGKFTFGTDAATIMTRDEDGIVITYSVTDTAQPQLQMSFTTGSSFSGYDGRVENVQGNWVFTFGL